MDYRSYGEKLLHGKIQVVLYQLSLPHKNKNDFALVVGTLRDMRVFLDKRQSGCSSGLHAPSDCLCEHGIEKTTRTIKKEGANKPHAPYLS